MTKNLMGMEERIYAIAESKNDYGKIFEEYIAETYNLTLSESNTDKWDAYTSDGTPVSIKHVGSKNELIMSCILRQSEVDRDFYLCVGFWEGIEHNIVEIYVIKITKEFWSSLFDREIIEKFRAMLEIDKSIKDKNKDNDLFCYETHSKYWANHYNNLTTKWRDNGYTILTPRSRNYKGGTINRVQCAINNTILREKILNSNLLKKVKCKTPSIEEYVKRSSDWLCEKMFERNYELKDGSYTLVNKTKKYFSEEKYEDIIAHQRAIRIMSDYDINSITNPFEI